MEGANGETKVLYVMLQGYEKRVYNRSKFPSFCYCEKMKLVMSEAQCYAWAVISALYPGNSHCISK